MNLRKLLPTEDIIYKTRLKEEEIIQRLHDGIEHRTTWSRNSSRNSEKPYYGQITGKEFRLERNIRYRNSFLPQINGVVGKDFDGMTRIDVKMRLHKMLYVFFIIWCAIIGTPFLYFLYKSIMGLYLHRSLTIPFLMMAFLYGMTMGGFKMESSTSKKDLKELFEAEILEH